MAIRSSSPLPRRSKPCAEATCCSTNAPPTPSASIASSASFPAPPPALILRGDSPGQTCEHLAPDRVLGILTTYERNGRVRRARHPLRRLAGLLWPRLRNRALVATGRYARYQQSIADPPDLALLKAALKATLRGGDNAADDTPAPTVNPKALVATARRHGVLALCASELIRRCPAAEPPIRDALRAMAFETETNLACVADALGALHDAGLTPLIVKGPALAALAYGDPTLRPYDDVDLLLDGADRAHALAVLQNIGWRDSRNAPPLAQRHLLRTTEDLALVHPRCDVGLELIHPGGILIDAAPAAESTPCPFEIHGTAARAPSTTDHFLYCAAHGAKHGYTRLVWLADLDRLAATFAADDWATVMSQAKARRLARALGLSIALLQKVLGTPVPPEFETPAKRMDWIEATSTRCLDAQARGDRHVETWRWWMALQDTVGQRLRHCRRWLFTPTGADLRACALPLWAHRGYRILRPLRLLVRLVFRRPAPPLTWDPR